MMDRGGARRFRRWLSAQHSIRRSVKLSDSSGRCIRTTMGEVVLRWPCAGGLSATSKFRVEHAPGSSCAPGRLRGGESAYLCWRDAKQLFEVSGELVGAGIAVRGDEVLDGCRGLRWVLQMTVASLQA
jgi:hypothetical protein